jgi:hypothetical protein
MLNNLESIKGLKSAISASLALTLMALIFVNAAAAQSQTQLPLPPQFAMDVDTEFRSATIDEIARSVSDRCRVTIVLDGEPAATRANLRLNCSLKQALDTVADQFDYSWRYSRSGAVLFEKRYKDPKTRPQANLPEMQEMTRSIVRALSSESYDPDETHWPDMIRSVAQTFTAAQRTLLQTGGQLHGIDLLPAQQRALQQAILSNTFSHPLSAWSTSQQALDNMPKSYLMARSRDEVSPQPGAPKFDYLFIYRTVGGSLSVSELPHIVYGSGDYKVVTP